MMIKFFLFVFTILFSICYAQILSDYGIKIGMVFSKHEMDRKNYSEDYGVTNYYKKSRLGPNGGIYIRYYIRKYFNFETELSYVQKGAKFKQDGLPVNIPKELRLEYVQFKNSLVLKIDINDSEIYSILGLSLDYMFSVEGGNLTHRKYRKYVLGYILGIGFKTGFFFYNQILLEIIFNKDIDEIWEDRWARYYNNLVSLNLGLSIKNLL